MSGPAQGRVARPWLTTAGDPCPGLSPIGPHGSAQPPPHLGYTGRPVRGPPSSPRARREGSRVLTRAVRGQGSRMRGVGVSPPAWRLGRWTLTLSSAGSSCAASSPPASWAGPASLPGSSLPSHSRTGPPGASAGLRSWSLAAPHPGLWRCLRSAPPSCGDARVPSGGPWEGHSESFSGSLPDPPPSPPHRLPGVCLWLSGCLPMSPCLCSELRQQGRLHAEQTAQSRVDAAQAPSVAPPPAELCGRRCCRLPLLTGPASGPGLCPLHSPFPRALVLSSASGGRRHAPASSCPAASLCAPCCQAALRTTGWSCLQDEVWQHGHGLRAAWCLLGNIVLGWGVPPPGPALLSGSFLQASPVSAAS